MTTPNFNAFQALNPDMLMNIVKQAEEQKEEREAAGQSGGFVEGIPLAYLPAGKHKMRIFADPNLQMYRMVRYFTVYDPFKRIMDPRFYKQTDGTYKTPDGTVIDNEIIERIWDLTSDLDYGYLSRTSCLFYGLLIDTDSPSDYWQKGNLYLVQGNTKFEAAWMAQMASLSQNPEIAGHISNSLNPTVPGWGWELIVVGGAQGSVGITPTFMQNQPAAEIDDKYIPLADQVVKDGFSMEDFKRIEDHLLAARAESGLDDEGAPTDPSDPDAGNAPEDNAGAGTTIDGAAGAGTTVVDAGTAGQDNSGRDALAAAMGGTQTATGEASTGQVLNQDAKTDATDTKEPTDAVETYGLTEAQITAAKAANMDLKAFAEMIGIK